MAVESSVAQQSADAVIKDIGVRGLVIEDYLQRHGPLLRALADEITDADMDLLSPHLNERQLSILGGADEINRRLVAIALAVHYGVGDVAERTGLVPNTPPASIHAMSHDEIATGGAAGYADLVNEACREVGVDLRTPHRVLDFGCSSGRVVRMLAARLPATEFHGCDVNTDAVGWASLNVPRVEFKAQPLRPPLDYPDGHFDVAYAISIWSHFAEESALVWLQEMARVIKPGGLAILTTHGFPAIAARAADPRHGPAAQAPMLEGLYKYGYVFVDSFGAAGDWGVVDPQWGNTFLTPEWLLQKITPAWSVKLFRPGGVEGHQDLYVLGRER